MLLRYNDTPERAALRKEILPKQDMIEAIMIPALKSKMKSVFVDILKQEIEIYKAFPKSGKMDVKTFDTRNHKTCFQGQAHDVKNGPVQSADLAEYRQAVGTLPHSVWGRCTLLEIWGADHFEKFPLMVTNVFRYCKGELKNCPTVKFEVMPLFNYSETGKYKTDEDDREVALNRYRIQMNGERAEYGLKPMKEVKGEWLQDFEALWKNKSKIFTEAGE